LRFFPEEAYDLSVGKQTPTDSEQLRLQLMLAIFLTIYITYL
jgi:hypothetical protein